MASYHSSFTYLEKNSAEQGYIIVAFEPDNGFKDTFLGMDQVYEDYYDGTKKFLYGTRYNTTATINISLIKADGTDWTINDNRRALKWLTGARTASWLDLYQGDRIKYSFLGTVTAPQQYKLDGRVVGLSFEFASITPWAYSAEQVFDRTIQQGLYSTDSGILCNGSLSEDAYFAVTDDGIVCNSKTPGPGACFCVSDGGVAYVQDVIIAPIDNETDDEYSYIYLDIEFINETCEYLEIKNETLEEVTRVDDIQPNDIIRITNKQFIVAYTKDQITEELINQNRIFGDNFNFVWPRLAPGLNNFVIYGSGNGTVKFSYRYPMKVGDCAMDIITYGSDTICDNISDIPSYDNIRWKDIIDTPTTVKGYAINDAYTVNQVYNKEEIDNKVEEIEDNILEYINIDEKQLNNMLEDVLV